MAEVGLVGRAGEVGLLRALVADVAGGRGRSVWVEGEPGIGKSALMAIALDAAEESGCEVYHLRRTTRARSFRYVRCWMHSG